MSTMQRCGLGVAFVLACGPVTVPDATGDSKSTSDAGSTSGTGTTDIASTGSSSTPTSTTTITSDASTCGDACPTNDTLAFLLAPDAYQGPVDCDPLAQDCKDGQKCSPYAAGGGSAWNATKCVPVTGDREPGESCTAEGGGVSGLDDCVKGALCWDVDAENHGVCVEQCGGSFAMLTCKQPGFGCAFIGEILNFCVETCDPLVQACPNGDLCLPVNSTYTCVLDASGDLGALFDPCEYANACDPGLICLSPASAAQCDQGATGCCLPMCSIADDGAACPGQGQSCFPMYEQQPVGFEDVGYCSLMP